MNSKVPREEYEREKTRERRVRRACNRRGLTLRKHLTRTKSHPFYGKYQVRRAVRKLAFPGLEVGQSVEWTTLEEVENWLDQTAEPAQAAQAAFD